MDEFFDTCAEIESTMSLIYRRMADAVRGNDRLRGLMLQMAKDEADHVNQIRFARLLPAESSIAGPTLSKTRLDLLLLKAQSLLQGIEDARLGEDEVLLQAIAMEEDFMQAHAGSAVEFTDPKLKERLQLLAREDERHIATLRDYYQEVYQRSA
ncbi:ferritin family protein [Geoalkalibacter sp.]|uniref:ferritin family protein n=1 Tax=Geoalkalibacter sp. TaxID=3041440 RepID=UPI00272E73A5|nr:ferritin family protein [Geoalkalibacter sp.]